MKFSICVFILSLYGYSTHASIHPCNSSELFDVLLRDFWILQFGHSYLGGQLPDSEASYALTVASCQVYKTQFERHRFLLQACFQAGEYKSTALQHRMAGLCNPSVLASLKPNLACLRNIYASPSYDICMAAALQQLSNNETADVAPSPLRYSDAPFHCVTVRQSILCSQQPLNVHCNVDQHNSVQAMFDVVWGNNAVVESHYQCPLQPLPPFRRKTIKESDLPTADQRNLEAFCGSIAKAASDALTKSTVAHPSRIIREILIDEHAPVLSNITNRLSSYVQCSRLAFLGTNQGGRGVAFSPMHDWMSILETFVDIVQHLKRTITTNATCVIELQTHRESTPCFQCLDKFIPRYSFSDFRYNRFSFATYAQAIIRDSDPLAFCRASTSLVKFLECLIQSIFHTCGMEAAPVSAEIEAMKNDTATIYGCQISDPWYSDLELIPAYDPQRKMQLATVSANASTFCDR